MHSEAIKTSGAGPRQRLLFVGEARLSDAECVALVVRSRGGLRTPEEFAVGLLDRFGGVGGLAAVPARELAAVRGIGPVRAAAVVAAFGLARRLTEQRVLAGGRIRGAGDVARLVRDATRDAGRECFFAILLDARHRMIGLRTISIGDLSAAPVHPREVFHPALRERAAALVVAHNHPSGDATPSGPDRGVTERLRAVGELVGIELLDHVVVGAREYFSFAEEATLSIP